MAALAAEPRGAEEACPVCRGRPRVLLVMAHRAMRDLTCELLEREFGCWVATDVRPGEALGSTLDRLAPDLLVIDAAGFPVSCLDALEHIRPGRIIVVGPEPDPAYRETALAGGAGGWLPRDRVAEELGPEMRRVLHCTHAPCPAGRP